MTQVTKYGFTLLAVICAIKISLFLWSYSQFDFQTYPSDTPLSIWDRWDANAYKTIALEGYTSTTIAPDYRAFLSHFPPIYPFTMWAVHSLSFLPVREAGMLISFVAIMGASYLMYNLVFDVYGNIRLAFLSALLLNLYPVSYFTLAPYTESLFLFFIIFSFWWLNKYPKHSYVTGIAGALAILTRLLGIAVIPAYIWFTWKKYRQSKNISFSDLLLIFLPILAISIYLAINKYYFGDPLFFLHEYTTNPYSNKTTMWPLQETFQSLIMIFQKAKEGAWDSFLMNTTGYNSLFTAFVLIVTLGGFFKRIRIEWMIFGLTYILLFSSFHWGISNARYGLAVFPMFIVLASIKNRLGLSQIIIGFVILLLYFTRIFTSGSWAF